MKTILLTLMVFCFILANYSQELPQVIATTSQKSYTLEDLSPEALEQVRLMPERLKKLRLNLLEEMVSEILLEQEAKSKQTSKEALIREIKKQVKKPTENEIRKVYEANKNHFNQKTFEEARPEIIEYLTSHAEQETFKKYFEKLKRKFRVMLTDFDSDLKPQNSIAKIGSRHITLAEFEEKNQTLIRDAQAEFYEWLFGVIEEKIFNDLVTTEASARGITANELIAQEITDKASDFSEVEAEILYARFRKSLFSKYNAKIALKDIAPRQRIQIDESPSKGNPNASVILVMFSDFQCPACATAHPILQEILNRFPNQVRLVVKNFPLERHKEAFLAAKAAKAAERQGKFFEYIEILYKNQQSLDPNSLKSYAALLDLDIKKFETDLKDKKIAESIEKDISEGKKLAVRATPTIFVNGTKVYNLTVRNLVRAIEKALESV
ncbi:MAG: thioredoxin domain-containing protein [Acidobacteriota bacterium]|nr:thioredoxin domain-containing protein [Acidobacteriota bacterium]